MNHPQITRITRISFSFAGENPAVSCVRCGNPLIACDVSRLGVAAAGLFAQAGIAEETLFRGFLFAAPRGSDSFPQAYLELGCRTIWGPAIVHFIVQGVIKVIVVDGPPAASFPLVWMAACGVIPFAAFMARREPEWSRESTRAKMWLRIR